MQRTVQKNDTTSDARPAEMLSAEGQSALAWWARIAASPLLPIAVIVAAAFVLYARALSGSFVSDDEQQILQNVFVTNPHLWRHIFGDSVWAFMGSGNAAKFYRPLMIFCFWILYRLGGPEPFYFHLFQVFLFAAGGIALYFMGREIIGGKAAALAASLLWIAHPQKVEAVAWISALCDTGCGLFYFLSFYLFLRAERCSDNRAASPGRRSLYGFSSFSLIAFVLALLFKEMALSFPLLLIAYWFFHPRKGGAKGRVLRFVPYAAAVAVYLIVRRLALGHLTANGHIFQITGRMLADAAALLGAHTSIFFWPVHLSVYRVFHAEQALASPWPWATLVVLALVLWFRKRQPELAFLIFWWPLTLIPCLDIRQLSNPAVADRMSYIPSAGLCLALGFLVEWVYRRSSASQIARWGRAAAVAGIGILFVIGCVATSRAIPLWNNNQAIVNYSLKRDPDSSYVHLIHGWELRYLHNDLAGAGREFETAARLNRQSSRPQITVEYQALIGEGAVAQAQGNLAAAVADYHQAIRVAPRLRDAYLSLGTLYLPRHEYAQAAPYFEKAVEGDRYDGSAAYLLGTCWMQLGKFNQAAQAFHAAREVNPDFWPAYKQEASALAKAGDKKQADAVLALISKKKGS